MLVSINYNEINQKESLKDIGCINAAQVITISSTVQDSLVFTMLMGKTLLRILNFRLSKPITLYT